VPSNGDGRHVGLTDYGAERAPLFAQGVFLHARGDAHTLGFDFGVEDFGLVGLAGVEQAAFGVGAVLRDFVEVAAGVEKFLRGKDTNEGHFHGAFDTDALLFGFDGGELCFVAENVFREAEFARGDDGLLDEEALFAAADRAAADFVTRVANGGIGVEAGLLAAGVGGADFGFGLVESGIVFAREMLPWWCSPVCCWEGGICIGCWAREIGAKTRQSGKKNCAERSRSN